MSCSPPSAVLGQAAEARRRASSFVVSARVLLPPPPPNKHGETIRHLVSDELERDQRVLQTAAVILRDECRSALGGADGSKAWAQKTLERYPGARLAATVESNTAALLFFRNGKMAEIGVHLANGELDPALLASVGYALDVAGRLEPSGPAPVTLVAGGLEVEVFVRSVFG